MADLAFKTFLEESVDEKSTAAKHTSLSELFREQKTTATLHRS